jgi:hypothetical protein
MGIGTTLHQNFLQHSCRKINILSKILSEPPELQIPKEAAPPKVFKIPKVMRR